MKKSRKIWHCVAFFAALAAVTAAVMLLWNCLIPGVIGWSAITYWQALGLIVLCRLLLGGFGRHGLSCCGSHHHHGHGGHLHEKFHGMSRQQRREFIRRKMCDWGCEETPEKATEETQRPQ